MPLATDIVDDMAAGARGSPPSLEQLDLYFRKLRTELNSHLGDIEIVSFDHETGALRLRFLGVCTTCQKRAITFSTAILPLVETIPGVESVCIEGFDVSDAVVDRIQSMLLPPSKRRRKTS